MRISFSSRPPLSSPSRATPRSLGREQTVALEEEIQSLLQKGAIRRCPRRAAGFYSTMFVTPKKGGSWRPIINLRSLNRYVITPHFKMETIQNLKDVLHQGDFMAKIDLKDAYQAVPSTNQIASTSGSCGRARHSNFLPYPLGWHQPHWCLQTTQTSGSLPAANGDKDHDIPGRYTDHGPLSGGGVQEPSTGDSDPHPPGFCDQPEEMYTHPNSVDRVSRVRGGLRPDGSLSAPGQGQQDKEGVQAYGQSIGGLRSLPGPPDRPANLLLTRSPDCPATLPGPSGPQDEDPVLQQSGLRSQGPIVSSGICRPVLVGGECEPGNVPAYSPTICIPEPGNGCINSGLGSPVPGIIPEDGGSLDQRGSNSPHKLARVDGSLPGSPLLCKGQEQDPHPTFHGQQSGNSLCQSPRGHAFQGPVLPGPRVLGVVHAEKDHPPCSPHPGQGQCDGRLGVSPQHRLQRLEARPGDFQGDPEATGTILCGPLCELPEHPIGDVLQLEARPCSSSGGCLEPAMVRSPPLHVSTVRSDREMSPQSQVRRSGPGRADSTLVACSSVVPNIDEHALSPPGPPTLTAEPSHRLPGSKPSADNSGAPDSSSLACVQNQGVSSASASLICASWREGTSRAYQSAWKRWVDWCGEREIDPCSTTVGNIVNFLTEIFNEGKGHSTLNRYRSAISMSHGATDGSPIGQHPLVSRLLQGMFNTRPPKPKSSLVWNVDTVVTHIKNRPASEELSLKELSQKVVTLLALTNADRASDLYLLTLSHRRYHEDRVTFLIEGLGKTRRSGPPREVSYHAFPDCPNICPMETLRVYERKTLSLRNETDPLLISCVKPHKQVATSTISRWIKAMLREAGVDANAHSTRSASTSAAFAAGLSTKDIMNAACWSRESTFKRFYCRPISNTESFSSLILRGRYAASLL